METGYCCQADIVLKHSCAASEIRTKFAAQSATRRSEKWQSLLRGHRGALFITAFQQLTRDRTCSHPSVPALIQPALDPAHWTHTPMLALFSYDIGWTPSSPFLCTLSRCSRLPSSLTRETRNKQAIYIPRVAIVGYRCEVQFFPDFSFTFSLSISCFSLLIIRIFSLLPSSNMLFILSFNFKNTGLWFWSSCALQAHFVATLSQHQLSFIW